MNKLLTEKFQTIIEWYAKNNPEETRQLIATPASKEQLEQLQQLIEKPLPTEFTTLYSSFNGEEGPGMGIFLAHSFLSLPEIISAVELSNTFVKPEKRIIENAAESERLIKLLIEVFKQALPENTAWYKFEFMCAPNTIGYPYYFTDENTTDRQKTMFNIDDEAQLRIGALTKQLHELEKTGYNWDELHVTAYHHDGDYNVQRKDFDFIADIPFTSFPEGAIKKKYFNPNWIPVIFDNLGNYIGIDTDPDVNGITGQVINFGRDEEDMFVIAPTFEKFLDFNLELIEKDAEQFLGGRHIHDLYKEIILQ